jgi:hypothetical protein
VKLKPQRLEKRIIRTHDEAVLRAILHYRPKTFAQRPFMRSYQRSSTQDVA